MSRSMKHQKRTNTKSTKKSATSRPPPSSPHSPPAVAPTSTNTVLPITFLPTTPSKKELLRLGGIKPVLQLLGSRKSSLSQTAALVLSNCTGEDRQVSLALLAMEQHDNATTETAATAATEATAATPLVHAGLAPLIEHLTDADDIVALHVAKTLAHCTAACTDKKATLYLANVLRRLGGLRLLIGSISPLPQHMKLTAAILLSLGNLCCDDTVLCNEMRDMGALESLLLLLRPGRPLVLRDRATSTLLNCVEGTEELSKEAMEEELVSIGAVSALTRAVETLIDGRTIVPTTTAANATTATTATTVAASSHSMHRATEPMTCGLLDLLLKCCGRTVTNMGSTGCDELQDCGGVQLCMILLEDKRPSVQERACRLLGYACGSAGRNARDIKRAVWSNNGGALTLLIALVEHPKKNVAKSARRCLDGLRNRPTLLPTRKLSSTLQGNEMQIQKKASTGSIRSTRSVGGKRGGEGGEVDAKTSDEVLLPLIEQGIVPIFHRIASQLDVAMEEIPPESDSSSSSSSSSSMTVNSKKDKKQKKGKHKGKGKLHDKNNKDNIKRKKEMTRKVLVQNFAADYLVWLELAVSGDGQQGGSATFRVLLRTLCMSGNEQLRGHVAIALVILCFKHALLRKSFVEEGALDATLSMLRNPEGRSHALEFLYTMKPIVRECMEVITRAKDKTGAALTNPYAAAAAGKYFNCVVALYFLLCSD